MYLLVFVFGVIPGRVSSVVVAWVRFFIPLNFGDNVLHLVTFALAFALYFGARRAARHRYTGRTAGQPT